MSRFVQFAILASLLTGFSLYAQPPRNFFAWWDSPVVKDLNLSDDQSHQIRDVVKEYRLKLIDQRAAVEKAEAQLEDAFNDDSFDQRRASDLVEHLVAARGDITRSFAQMSLRLRAVLTTDQYKELLKRRPGLQPGQFRREFQNRRNMQGGRNPTGQGPSPTPQAPPQQQQ